MKKIIFSIIAILANYLGFAHGYWLEVKGTGKINQPATVYLYFGEFEKGLRENKPYFLKNMETFSAWYIDATGNQQRLQLQKDTNCYKAVIQPTAEGVYTIFMTENKRSVQDWKQHGLGIVRPIEIVKTTYTVGNVKKVKVATINDMMLDIIPIEGEKYLVNTMGKPFQDINVSFTSPSGKLVKLKTNQAGIVTIAAVEQGNYIIDIDYSDRQAGEYNGKQFEATRYKLAYTFLNH